MCNECSKKIFLTTTCWSKETLSIFIKKFSLSLEGLPNVPEIFEY
jgi:hypothetical protein